MININKNIDNLKKCLNMRFEIMTLDIDNIDVFETIELLKNIITNILVLQTKNATIKNNKMLMIFDLFGEKTIYKINNLDINGFNVSETIDVYEHVSKHKNATYETKGKQVHRILYNNKIITVITRNKQ